MASVEGGSSVKASEMNYFHGRKEQLGHSPSIIVMDTNSAFTCIRLDFNCGCAWHGERSFASHSLLDTNRPRIVDHDSLDTLHLHETASS